MSRIAGIVVLYNPSSEVLDNINSYLRQVDILYAVDNSENQDQIIVGNIRKLKNVVYQWNRENLGIARALNIGAAIALNQHYEYLLIMDQDSFASPNLIAEFINYLEKNPSENIGILSPYHIYINYDRPAESSEAKEIFLAITSGTLLNLYAYKLCGPFRDELFIDSVDFEYCLRIRLNGYRIVQINKALLRHQLGALKKKSFLFRDVAVYNHPPIRVYYKFRNRLYVAFEYFKVYPKWSIKEFTGMGNELIKILCFEKNKFDKCLMAFLGITHCFKGRFGKFNNKIDML
jgi:rhamnosyltransferase